MAVGINEVLASADPINLYPNPGNGQITVDLKDFNATKITVANSLGQEIYSRQIQAEDSVDLSFSEKQSGVYFVKCESETRSVTKKIIIN